MTISDVLRSFTDESLSREVASQTRLIRQGWSAHGLQSAMDECRRRNRMYIFHEAQEREFSRPCESLNLTPLNRKPTKETP